MFTFALVLLLVDVEYSLGANRFPPYLTLCKRKDPDVNGCVRRAVEQLRPHFGTGIPQLLLPPLNPLVLPEASLDDGKGFKASFKNIQMHHGDEFQLDDLNLDFDNYLINMTLRFPRMRIQAQYNIDGKLLILQLQGNGPAEGNFTDVRANVLIKGHPFLRKGKEYLSIGVEHINLKLGKPVFYFGNIFKNNEDLNIQTNKVINENIEDIIDELRPILHKTIIQVTSGIVDRIFNKFSFDELFPQ